jgi:hypothetical protein
MTDSELHPYVELIAREARRPVVTDPAARARIMAAVRAESPPHRLSVWRRVLQPRAFTLSPVAGSLLAAGLVGIGVIAGGLRSNRDGRLSAGAPVAPAQRLPVSDTVVKFIFHAPNAAKVSLVGDFNGWDGEKTQMVRAGNSGLWTVTLPLTAGRHLYAFLVDGTWHADPTEPVAGDDGFGHANSVRIVARGVGL